MKISNIRLGFATNSSSTHSLIFNLKLSKNHSSEWFNQEFGWEEFLCNDVESKSAYFCQTLYQNLAREIGSELAAAVALQWTGVEVNADGYIDHQSLMTLPYNFKTKQVDETFFKELLEWHKRPEVAIVGGNDNQEGGHVPEYNGDRHRHLLPTDTGYKFVCRKDRLNKYWWTIFNKNTGAKLRISFHNDAPPYNKSFAPELVDVKITDFCNGGSCSSYCYQDSSKQGKYANIDWLRSLAYELSDLEVFEVALGGGEPTLHPQFVDILEMFHHNSITPNFTTRSLHWLNDPKIVEAVKKYCGRFAVSVSTPSDVDKAVYNSEFLEIGDRGDGNKLSVQYVMGTSNRFRDICEAVNRCGLDLTLLGYKRSGRGKDWKPYPYTDWIETVQDVLKYSRVGIDTTLANEFKEQLLSLQNSKFFTFEEGKFSMYVDAVEQKAAPSSFADQKQFIDVKELYNNHLDKVFSQF